MVQYIDKFMDMCVVKVMPGEVKSQRRSVEHSTAQCLNRRKNIRDMQISADLFSVKLEMKTNELDLCGTEPQQQQNYVDVSSVAFLPATV